MASSKMQKQGEWYRNVRPRYERLGRTVAGLLQELLAAREFEFLAVTTRTKTVDSFLEKLKRKAYSDPRLEVTDFCGVRVITYLESDVNAVSDLIREVFDVDESKSVDKTTALSVNQVGYRSVHFVCSISEERLRLPEYSDFSGLQFEVQVRTALQHAWAQIEHDRNYKFSGVLPNLIQRRLYLAAGLLETADREFAAIAKEIDDYAVEVASRTAAGDLDISIDSTSLLSYARERFSELFGDDVEIISYSGPRDQVVAELRAFGIETLDELDGLLSPEFVSRVKEHYSVDQLTDIGLLRDAMMFNDPKKYFQKAWKRHWRYMPSIARGFLVKAHGRQMVDSLVKGKGITVEEEEEEE